MKIVIMLLLGCAFIILYALMRSASLADEKWVEIIQKKATPAGGEHNVG
ncbi:MAG: hypothetical protein ACK5ML_10360 [Lachnospiraceae bacterium]